MNGVDQTPRGFRTDFDSHKGLMHTFARRAFARLRDSGVWVEYEDVFQEVCVAYTMALKTYDPVKGITFTAYMGRAVANNIGRYALSLTREYAELGMYTNDEIVEEYSSTESRYEDRPDYACEYRQDVQNRLESLTPLTREIITELINPSESTRQAHAGMRARAEYSKSIGVRAWSVPDDINLRLLFKHFRLNQYERRAVKNELFNKLGVSIK